MISQPFLCHDHRAVAKYMMLYLNLSLSFSLSLSLSLSLSIYIYIYIYIYILTYHMMLYLNMCTFEHINPSTHEGDG